MNSDFYISDDDVYEDDEIAIDDIPAEVERIYENACNRGTLHDVKIHLTSLLNIYDINRKMIKFQDELMCIYKDVIDGYLYTQAPGEVFNANSYNLMQEFIIWALENTDKGIELQYLDRIYMSITN